MIIYKNNANIIEKILRTLIIFVITAAFILPLLTPTVFATSSVTISTADTIKGGDTFTAVVTFGGGNVGRVDAQLTYDTDMLTYISGGSSSGNSGYIQLKDAGTDGSVVFNIEFQALTEGDASIEVLTNEMYDLDEMMIEPVSASKTISIEGNVKEEEKITDTSSPDQPVEITEPEGVDTFTDSAEMEENDEYEPFGIAGLFIITAVIAVILIVIIAIVLTRKKKPTAKTHTSVVRENPQHDENIRVGRSGRPLDFKADRENTFSSRDTKVWGDWNLDDRDDSDDIEKW